MMKTLPTLILVLIQDDLQILFKTSSPETVRIVVRPTHPPTPFIPITGTFLNQLPYPLQSHISSVLSHCFNSFLQTRFLYLDYIYRYVRLFTSYRKFNKALRNIRSQTRSKLTSTTGFNLVPLNLLRILFHQSHFL